MTEAPPAKVPSAKSLPVDGPLYEIALNEALLADVPLIEALQV